MDYGIICDIGGKKKVNEDSAYYIDFTMVAAPGSTETSHFAQHVICALVCDGVSSSNHGEKASSFVIQILSSKILSFFSTGLFNLKNFHEKLAILIENTNTELREHFQDDISKGRVPQTTLVGLIIIGPWLWCFNLGDSRAYLIKDGNIAQISKDQVGITTSHEIIEALGQEKIHPIIILYNWAHNNPKDQETESFTQSYYALLCSDGLSDKVTPDEIQVTLSDTGKNLSEKIFNLYNMSLNRGIEDNISIIGMDLAEYYKSISPIQKIKLHLTDENYAT